MPTGEKTQYFEFGDIVSLSGKSKTKYLRGIKHFLIYDVKDYEILALAMMPKECADNPDAIIISKKDLIEGTIPEDRIIRIDNISVLDNDSDFQKTGKISQNKIDEMLRRMAHGIVLKHYESIHRNKKEFMPGKAYIPYSGRVYDSEEIKCLVDSAFDFWLTSGKYARQFEKELAAFLGAKYCLLTNSGSSANLLAMSALTSKKLGEKRLKPGDEVISVACAFPTTVNPIIQNNLIPVFLDVDIGTYNIQADKIEDALSEKTKAIFLAHTLGNPFELDKIQEICKKHDLWLIEDNCDALGSNYRKKYTGSFGHISTFSFYPPHHITMGEGGALVTNEPHLKRIIESFRDWGRDCWCESGCDNSCGRRFGWQLGDLPKGYDHKYIYSHIGYNLKITDMQAAIGTAQLKKLPEFISARKRNWKRIYDGLKKYDDHFIMPEATQHSDPSWFGFILTVREDAGFSKNEIVKYLEDKKIATRQLFAGNITRQPYFENIEYRIHGTLENTDSIMNNTFWIGVYPGLDKEMIDYMIMHIEEFIAKKLI